MHESLPTRHNLVGRKEKKKKKKEKKSAFIEAQA